MQISVSELLELAPLIATPVELQQINAKLDQLIQQGDDRAAAKTLAVDVEARAEALQAAVDSSQPHQGV